MSKAPSIWEWILDFFWPTRCAFCGEMIAPNKSCCTQCRQKLTPCPPLTLTCLNACFVFTDYSLDVSHAVHRFKFQNHPQLAKLFARMICDRFGTELLDLHPDCICGVPMHPKKKFKRGYNQADLLAKEMARLLNIPFVPLLEKTSNTKEQHTLSAAQRQQNLIGVFQTAMPEKVCGKHILIVDDVITTGATLNECALALRASDAQWVGGVAFAHPILPPKQSETSSSAKNPEA